MKQVLLGTALGVAGIIGTPLAGAQTAAAPAEVEGLEKVVVTVQRRDETAQDVGIAVSVISGKTLAERGITNVNQLQNQTPALEVEPAFGSGQPEFRLRGVGFHDYASNNTSTVTVNVDEVAYGLPILTQGLLFDIDRVEVLRGPQGTLYGRNTTGGAVNFITRKPTSVFGAGVTVDVDSNEEKRLEAYVSGPFSDTVRGRIAFATDQGGAWQKNRATGEKLGDADRSAVRAQIEWNPTASVDLRFEVHASQDQSDGQGLHLFKPLATANGTGPTIAADTDRKATGWGLRPAFASIIGASADAKPFKDNDGSGGSVTATIDLGAVALTSITSVESFKRREYNDWDASPSAEADEYFDSDVDTLSQEVRLASNGDQRVNWVAGLYYAKEKLGEQWYSDFTDIFGFIAHTSYRQRAESTAVFGQIDTKLDERLKLVAGLRYERETRELDDFTTTTIPVIGIGVTNIDQSLDKNSVTGKIGLDYKLAPTTLLYTSLSRGVKSGGFTAYNTLAADALKPFEAETLYALEAGFKTDLTSALRLNGAVYHYDYRNQQIQSAIYDTSFGAIGKIVNAPKSRIDGVELELQWEPVAGLSINQALAYKVGKYREFRALDVSASVAAGASVYTDLSGKDLNFPKLSYGGAVSYTWVTGGWRLKAGTDYSYHDNYASWLGSAYDTPSYWLANANFAIGPTDAKWTVALWGRNIFDQKYDLTRNFFTNAQVAAAGKPATWGVQLNATF